MILGHFTATYAIREPLKNRFPLFEPVIPLLAGAIMPDVVDKTAARFFGLYSRGVAHSIIILSIVFFILYRLFAKHKATISTFFLGAFIHLIEDMPEAGVIFWPIMSSWHFQAPMTLLDKLHRYYFGMHTPFVLAMELLSYPFCIYFFWRNNSRRTLKERGDFK